MIARLGDLVDRVGVRLEPGTDATACLPLSIAVLHERRPLASALMLAADVASGIRLHRPGVESVLTRSFSFRRTDTPVAGKSVTAVSTRLSEHGRNVVDTVEFVTDTGAGIGFGRISFSVFRSGRHRAATDPGAAAVARFTAPRGAPIEEPLIDAAGIETIDAATGSVRLRPRPGLRRDDARSGATILQGAFVTLLGEAAALAIAGHELGVPSVVSSLDVEFFASVDAASVVTRARWLGTSGSADVEVVLRDAATGAALAAFVVGVTVAPRGAAGST